MIENHASYLNSGAQKLEVYFSNPEFTFPYALNISYDSSLPKSADKSPVALRTVISDQNYAVGDNVSMTIDVTNKKNESLGMVTSIIGIPSGTTVQPWQLKKFLDEEQVAYYEIFDNYLVFYWRAFNPNETKTLRLDLKADVAGTYQAPASVAYLYYGDEYKTWMKGNRVEIVEQ